MFYDKDAGALIGCIFQLTECAQVMIFKLLKLLKANMGDLIAKGLLAIFKACDGLRIDSNRFYRVFRF